MGYSAGGGGFVKLEVRQEGFSELRAMFAQLPADVQSSVLGEATLTGARVMAKTAKREAPRQASGERQSKNSEKYGRLRTNIKAIKLKKKRNSSRAAIASVGDAFWGAIIERGSRYMPANRWWERAYKNSEEAVLQAVKQRIVLGIEKRANRLIKKLGIS